MKSNEGQVNEKKQEKISCLEGVVCTNHGTHTQPVFKRVYDKDRDVNLVKQVDTFDLYDFIQASKSQTDFAVLQRRFIELGEIPAVDPELGSNDFTNMPSNIHEVYAMANDVASNFNSLPESIRNIFGSKEAYMKALLDGTYQATLINALTPKAVEKQEEKQESEGN